MSNRTDDIYIYIYVCVCDTAVVDMSPQSNESLSFSKCSCIKEKNYVMLF
jgi:hypothetical protein